MLTHYSARRRLRLGHGCIALPIILSATSISLRLATPEPCWWHSFFCGTRVPNFGVGVFVFYRAGFSCKASVILRTSLPAEQPKPNNPETACSDMPVTYNTNCTLWVRAPFGIKNIVK